MIFSDIYVYTSSFVYGIFSIEIIAIDFVEWVIICIIWQLCLTDKKNIYVSIFLNVAFKVSEFFFREDAPHIQVLKFIFILI